MSTVEILQCDDHVCERTYTSVENVSVLPSAPLHPLGTIALREPMLRNALTTLDPHWLVNI